MKKQILNIGTSLTKKELKAINGGATCILSCNNSTNQQIVCSGHRCENHAGYCTYSDTSDDRTKHTFCNNLGPIPEPPSLV